MPSGAFVARRNGRIFVTGNSGFPKSHDVSKAIDKAAGAEREMIGKRADGRYAYDFADNSGNVVNTRDVDKAVRRDDIGIITAPATDAARQWEGWGTALKPAYEPIILARKPLDGTVAANVLTHGTGGINIDDCRIAYESEADKENTRLRSLERAKNACSQKESRHEGWQRPWMEGDGLKRRIEESAERNAQLGRWPANVLHDGSEEVVGLFPVTNGSKPIQRKEGFRRFNGTDYAGGKEYITPAYESPGYEDTGSAARFFYCAKSSRSDRDEGLEGMEARRTGAMQGNLVDGQRLAGNGTPVATPVRANYHPTVKPTDLMRYLCRLVTPPGGVILDPFMGSGSTGKAAILEGFGFVGIELEPEYLEIARKRIEHAQRKSTQAQPPLFPNGAHP